MTTLFNRKVEVLLAVPLSEDLSTVSAQAILIQDLRVSFKVTKSLVKDPNTCELKIYNLAQSTRNSLPGTGAKVILRGGYAGSIEQLYIGDAKQIDHKQDGVEWVTKILCGDGYRASEHARVSTSFGPGTSFGAILKTLGRAAKIDIGNLDKVAAGLPQSAQYTQGYTAHGLALTELDKVLKAAGLEWSIQDGALQILAPGEATTEELIVLDASSGLVGSPEMSSPEKKTPGKKSSKPPAKPVLQAKSLLQGGFRCGRKVQVNSREHNGVFRTAKVEHTGDTKGGDWYSALELEVSS